MSTYRAKSIYVTALTYRHLALGAELEEMVIDEYAERILRTALADKFPNLEQIEQQYQEKRRKLTVEIRDLLKGKPDEVPHLYPTTTPLVAAPKP